MIININFDTVTVITTFINLMIILLTSSHRILYKKTQLQLAIKKITYYNNVDPPNNENTHTKELYDSDTKFNQHMQ